MLQKQRVMFAMHLVKIMWVMRLFNFVVDDLKLAMEALKVNTVKVDLKLKGKLTISLSKSLFYKPTNSPGIEIWRVNRQKRLFAMDKKLDKLIPYELIEENKIMLDIIYPQGTNI